MNQPYRDLAVPSPNGIQEQVNMTIYVLMDAIQDKDLKSFGKYVCFYDDRYDWISIQESDMRSSMNGTPTLLKRQSKEALRQCVINYQLSAKLGCSFVFAEVNMSMMVHR
jgi:hypothetical protein